VVIALERGAKPAFAFLVVELEDVVVTRVNSSWSGGLLDEEVAFGFGKVCWEYRRASTAAPVRFCFDLGSNRPA
jgi:type VI protein secretion system component Hcp